MRIELQQILAPVPERRPRVDRGELFISWIGQAGFILDSADLRILIDPYLSDSLAAKYRGKEFPHVRMSPPPVAPGKLSGVDLLFATHAHTDHLDPGTLPAVQSANPNCRCLVPRACRQTAVERGVDPARLLTVNAGESFSLTDSVRVHAVPAAHEKITVNESGDHLFLGYLIDFDGIVVYHSGDCVPFDGQEQLVRDLGARVLLLPVNGRDEYRTSHGIAGNFTLLESVHFAQAVDADYLIGHHFGMFDFNTIDLPSAREEIHDGFPAFEERYLLAAPGVSYRFTRRSTL